MRLRVLLAGALFCGALLGGLPARAAPLDTAPLDTAPIDTAPIDTAPIDTAPIDAAASVGGFRVTSVVGLVRGHDSDPAAERVVREVLRDSGAETILTSRGTPPDTYVTVWIGDGAAQLAALGVRDATDLPAEGYVLAVGRDEQARGHIVLDGADADGTFYAAQELRRSVVRRPGPDLIPTVRKREAPAMRLRGAIEGFYGTPWSHQDRLDILDYLGAHRMNTYEYAPKDDPYHREKWREPYPADKLAELGDLVKRARANHVDFTFALSPGLSICYSSAADRAALTAKFDALYDLGVRAFTVPLDDIDYDTWHCAADEERYGTGGAAAGRAQTDLLNHVQREWIASKGDVAALQMVPTEYADVSESAYKRALRERLDVAVVVHWTGVGVIPHDITRAQAAQAREVFGHDVLIWDNFPVNDYIAGRLPLGPYTGRQPGLSAEVAGVISNPMNQAAVSKVALYSFGEFGWDDKGYDATASWERALDERADGDPAVAAALRRFADLHYYDSTLHRERAPRLSAELAEFWPAWRAGRTAEAAGALRPVLRAVADAPRVVRQGVADPAFGRQAAAWLDATESWARAMQDSLDALVAIDAGDGATAWARREAATEQVARARAIRDVRAPHDQVAPFVGDGVVDSFVREVALEHDHSVDVGLDRPTAQASLDTYADNEPPRMLDGDLDTYFWSDAAPQAGDFVGVDLGRERPIGEVEVLMAKSGSPSDFIRSGVLEHSRDGSTWTELTRGTTAEVTATAPDGIRARYLRYRALADNAPNWLVVREFAVEALDGTTLTVTGKPAAAASTTLAAAADDNLASSYAAATPPRRGDALVVTLEPARSLDGLVVIQATGAAAAGSVQIRVGGRWRDVGGLTGAHTAVDLDGVETDAIRLAWAPGVSPPRVAEVVPRYAD